MTITPALQIALARWNAGIARSRREYAEHPTACDRWCIRCINPTGSNPACEGCRHALRERRNRAKKKEARDASR